MVLDWVKEENFYEDQIEHILRRKERESKLKDLDILKYSTRKNLPFDGLYEHQYESIKSYLSGDNICLTTDTSSGKSLVYSLCINREVEIDENSTALLLFPTKALSRDQKENIKDLYNEINSNASIGIYDGDSTKEEKNEALNSNLIITNFQGLNYYIEYHTRWSDFFKNLKTIVIDEAHSYTGVTGINVAFLIRRLKRIIGDVYNSDPQYILTSATIGNPEEHCKNLTGEDFKIFDKDKSEKSEKLISFWNPPSYKDDDMVKRKSSHSETSKLLSSCVKNDLKTLVFVRSRKLTEIVAKQSNEKVSQNINIEPYNAGHTKLERRTVENKLKNGEIDAVVSTNALELGIDIGELDCIIVDSYPGDRNSFWQQIGRAGRNKQKSYVFLVAQNKTLDQYVMKNPDYIFENNVEDCVIDLDNISIMKKHIICASSEKPIKEKDWKYFNKTNLEKVVNDLRDNNYVKGNYKSGIEYNLDEMPQKHIDIYSIGSNKYELKLFKKSDDVRTIPSIDKERAYRDFHEGAIYIHKGVKYKVVSFMDKKREIHLEEVDCDYTTRSTKDVKIKSTEEVTHQYINGIKIVKGKGTIEQYYDSFSKLKDNGSIETGFDTNINKPLRINTQLMWIEIPRETLKNLDMDSELGSLHAAEHALIKFSPTLIKLDSKDLGGLSTLKHNSNNMATIFIYDGIEGGIGFSWKIYNKIKNLSARTSDHIKTCDCNYESCPACTMSSSCGDDNEPLDAKGASKLLDLI